MDEIFPDPSTRDLYRWAQENEPIIYEMLCSLDRDLAQLHEAGIAIQQRRLTMLQGLLKSLNLKTIAPRALP